MELKDFVRDTLLDIVQGVKGALEKCKGTGVVICPMGGQVDKTYIRGPQTVSFNIVLGGEGSEDGSSGLKVSFLQFGFQIGSTKGESQKNSEQTSVNFTVPMYFSIQSE